MSELTDQGERQRGTVPRLARAGAGPGGPDAGAVDAGSAGGGARPGRAPSSPDASHHRVEALESEGCGVVLGRYTLLRKIAAGGMAEVFVALAPGVSGLSRKVAIKKILPQLSHNKHFIAMLIDEAKISVSLTHPNIAQVYELGVDASGSYFIVMEYVDGRPLHRVIQRANDQAGGPLSVTYAAHIIAEVAKGLDHAHRQKDAQGSSLRIVHRDISPQNVLVSYEGAVKLIDFGIARAQGRLGQTEHGIIKGKLRYLAPEIASGRDPDHRADIYCAGIVLFELLTGEPMFSPKNDMSALEMAKNARVRSPRSVNPSVPEELDAIVMRALRKDREERYPTAKDLYTDLRMFLNREAPIFNESELGETMQALFAREIVEGRELDGAAQALAASHAPRGFNEEPTVAVSPWGIESRRGPMPPPAPTDGEAPRAKVHLAAADGGSAMSIVLADVPALEPGASEGRGGGTAARPPPPPPPDGRPSTAVKTDGPAGRVDPRGRPYTALRSDPEPPRVEPPAARTRPPPLPAKTEVAEPRVDPALRGAPPPAPRGRDPDSPRADEPRVDPARTDEARVVGRPPELEPLRSPDGPRRPSPPPDLPDPGPDLSPWSHEPPALADLPPGLGSAQVSMGIAVPDTGSEPTAARQRPPRAAIARKTEGLAGFAPEGATEDWDWDAKSELVSEPSDPSEPSGDSTVTPAGRLASFESLESLESLVGDLSGSGTGVGALGHVRGGGSVSSSGESDNGPDTAEIALALAQVLPTPFAPARTTTIELPEPQDPPPAELADLVPKTTETPAVIGDLEGNVSLAAAVTAAAPPAEPPAPPTIARQPIAGTEQVARVRPAGGPKVGRPMSASLSVDVARGPLRGWLASAWSAGAGVRALLVFTGLCAIAALASIVSLLDAPAPEAATVVAPLVVDARVEPGSRDLPAPLSLARDNPSKAPLEDVEADGLEAAGEEGRAGATAPPSGPDGTAEPEDAARAEAEDPEGDRPRRREPAQGTLLINARPVSTVYVDGKKRGRTPLTVVLRPGKHEITLESPEGLLETKIRKITAGKNPPIIVRWRN